MTSEGRAGLEPAREHLTGTGSAAELPTLIRFLFAYACLRVLRVSNPPCSWKRQAVTDVCRFGHEPINKRKERESNPSRRCTRSTAFQAVAITHWLVLPTIRILHRSGSRLASVVALRIELSATRVSDGLGRPALDYLKCIRKK